MNSPPKLREQNGYCVPKGPLFPFTSHLDFTVFGNRLQVRVPWHWSKYEGRKALSAPRRYDKDTADFRPFNTDVVMDNSWQVDSIMHRSWAFYGPWFSGALAELSMSVAILTPTEPKPGVSFFHPRAFEGAVGDFLTFRYAKSVSHGCSDWLAPMDWSVITTQPCVAASLWVVANEEVTYPSKERRVFLPLGDQYLLTFSFDIQRSAAGSSAEIDNLIDPRPQLDLMTRILDSLVITLSPEAQAQQAKALQGVDHPALRTTFPPIKWTTTEQDAEWAAYQRSNQENAEIFRSHNRRVAGKG